MTFERALLSLQVFVCMSYLTEFLLLCALQVGQLTGSHYSSLAKVTMSSRAEHES